MPDKTVAELGAKLAQAREVIAYLLGRTALSGGEARRALDYFAGNAFEKDFLPWPRPQGDGLRPDQLSAANDD